MTTQNPLEANNEQISVVAERLSGRKVTLIITVTPPEVAQARREAIKAVNKEVKFDGFRPGKAPEALVLQHYQKPIHEEWRKETFRRGVGAALNLLKIRPYQQNGFSPPEWTELSLEKGAIFSTTFEEALSLPLIKPEELELSIPPTPTEVTEEEINRAIEEASKNTFAKSQEVEGPVQEGDEVRVNEIPESSESKSEEKEELFVHVDRTKTAEDLVDLLIGKNIGDRIEYHEKSEEPEESSAKPFIFMIQGITRQMPATMDDAFAQEHGHANLASLKNHVKGMIAVDKRQQWVANLHVLLDQQLLAKYPLEFPQSMIDKECKDRLEQIKSFVSKSGENDDKIAALQNAIRSAATNEMHLNYLFEAYAQMHQLEFLPDVIFLRKMEAAENNRRMFIEKYPDWANSSYKEAKDEAFQEAKGRSIRNHIIHAITGIPVPELTCLLIEGKKGKQTVEVVVSQEKEEEKYSCNEGCGCHDSFVKLGD